MMPIIPRSPNVKNKIEQQLEQFETKLDFDQVLEQSGALKVRSAKVRLELQRQAYLTSVCGVDLTRLPGLSTRAVEVIISETGLEMSCWKSAKHFCSWLKVCPDNRISGGKVLSSKSRKTKNRAAGMFRLAAQGAMQSKTAIGAFIRRIRARLGAPTAINAGDLGVDERSVKRHRTSIMAKLRVQSVNGVDPPRARSVSLERRKTCLLTWAWRPVLGCRQPGFPNHV
jgi:hypothetical protein